MVVAWGGIEPPTRGFSRQSTVRLGAPLSRRSVTVFGSAGCPAVAVTEPVAELPGVGRPMPMLNVEWNQGHGGGVGRTVADGLAWGAEGVAGAGTGGRLWPRSDGAGNVGVAHGELDVQAAADPNRKCASSAGTSFVLRSSGSSKRTCCQWRRLNPMAASP